MTDRSGPRSGGSAPFDPVTVLRALVEGDVRFVLIGGLAIRSHGSAILTNDVDICHARDEANLERLAVALRPLDARLRGPDIPADLPFRLDTAALAAGDHFTLATRAGNLDLLARPAGAEGGYDVLARNAHPVEVEGSTVLVAAVDDLVAMKRAAGRRKDLLMLEELAALRDRRDERGER